MDFSACASPPSYSTGPQHLALSLRRVLLPDFPKRKPRHRGPGLPQPLACGSRSCPTVAQDPLPVEHITGSSGKDLELQKARVLAWITQLPLGTGHWPLLQSQLSCTWRLRPVSSLPPGRRLTSSWPLETHLACTFSPLCMPAWILRRSLSNTQRPMKADLRKT